MLRGPEARQVIARGVSRVMGRPRCRLSPVRGDVFRRLGVPVLRILASIELGAIACPSPDGPGPSPFGPLGLGPTRETKAASGVAFTQKSCWNTASKGNLARSGWAL